MIGGITRLRKNSFLTCLTCGVSRYDKKKEEEPNPLELTPIDLTLLPDAQTKRVAEDLIKRHYFHTDLAKDLNKKYKKWGPVFLVLIPVYSAILSFVTSMFTGSRLILGGLALILTIATILNSILKPDEKFVASSFVLVRLKDWEADFALTLSEVIQTQDLKQIKTFLIRKNAELSEIGSSMARTYLPQKNA